jgi:hypothetical protein
MDQIDLIAACIMVDTIGLRIGDVDPSRLPKKFLQVDGDDSQKWAKGSLATELGKATYQVRGIKSRCEMNITGSPAFHRQGHNIVSSGDVAMLTFAMLQDVNRDLGLGISRERALNFAEGQGAEVTRIDTPVMVKVPDGLPIRAAINGLALAGVLAGNNTGLYVNESVYFDQHSQLASLKAYDKETEFRGKRKVQLPDTSNARQLLALAAHTIRLEPVYRRKYLQREFGGDKPLLPSMLTAETLAGMLIELLQTYDLRRDIRRPLNEEQLVSIPRQFRSTVLFWQHGHDLLRMLDGDKNQLSRHRSYLRNNHSIDIYGPPPVEIEGRVELGEILSPENFVPVPREIRADPALFFEYDMEAERARIRRRLAGAA